MGPRFQGEALWQKMEQNMTQRPSRQAGGTHREALGDGHLAVPQTTAQTVEQDITGAITNQYKS